MDPDSILFSDPAPLKQIISDPGGSGSTTLLLSLFLSLNFVSCLPPHPVHPWKRKTEEKILIFKYFMFFRTKYMPVRTYFLIFVYLAGEPAEDASSLRSKLVLSGFTEIGEAEEISVDHLSGENSSETS